VASGLGESLARPSSAFFTLAFLSLPSAANSNSSGFTLALARCAAICAPITPAPSTAALRMRMRPAFAAAPRESDASPARGAGAGGAWAGGGGGARGVRVSDMSGLHSGVGNVPRPAVLVDRDIGQLCFGDFHRLAAPVAAALREDFHVHGDGGVPHPAHPRVEPHEAAETDGVLEDA